MTIAGDLHKLIGSNDLQGLRDRCEQRFALLLLVKNCADLKEDWEFDQETWANAVTTTIPDTEDDNPVRYNTAKIIKTAIQTAPWSYTQADLNTPKHCFTTINEIFTCMKKVVSQLNIELSQAEEDGADLALYETEEMLTEDSLDEDNAEKQKRPARKKPGRKPRISDASSSDPISVPGYGGSRKWTDAEFLNLLRCVRDNFGKSWDIRLKAHNDSYIVPDDVKEKMLRTKEGMRQKIQLVIGLTPEGLLDKVKAKIRKMERGDGHE